ncbi:MAG: thioredoxin family protein [Planctomycetota bacterium]|nr:thioredoxin family protein [Planctomycetota bacterium]
MERNKLLIVVVLGAFALLLWSQRGGAKAPVPPAFQGSSTLQEATAASARDGKPVLVFATADWCGPCQSLKRGALAEASTTQAIQAETIPVYLDVDASGREASSLNVSTIPTLILLSEGREISRIGGAVSGSTLREWLETSVAATGKTSAPAVPAATEAGQGSGAGGA